MKRLRAGGRWARALVLAAALAGAGCNGSKHPAGLTDEQFVTVMVQLRRAAATSPESFEAEKQRILAAEGVTEESLQQFVEQHARDLDHLADVWEAVSDSLTEVAQ